MELLDRLKAYVEFYFVIWYCLYIWVYEVIISWFPKRKSFRGETILITGKGSGAGDRACGVSAFTTFVFKP